MKHFCKISLLFVAAFSFIQCSAAKTGDSTGVVIQNSYGQSIYVEIWSGKSIVYDAGNVKGTSLKKEVELTEVPNAQSTTFEFSTTNTVLIIVGILKNGAKEYLNASTYEGLSKDSTITIGSDGKMTRKDAKSGIL